MPDGNTTIIIQGKKRFIIDSIVQEKPYLKAKIENFIDLETDNKNKEFIATIDSIKDMAINIIKENPNIPSEASFAIKNIQSPTFLVNFVSSNMNLVIKDKQEILSIQSLKERALLLLLKRKGFSLLKD